jgi:CRP-like cAMP-binding protein
MFSFLTQNSIGKLSFFFNDKFFIRKQIVYKEGEKASHLFIVISGEFHLLKSINQDTP